MDLIMKECENGGVFDMDIKIVFFIILYDLGYLNKDIEKVVGF